MANSLKSIHWLRKLISYNTVSCYSNLDLINECKQYLEKNNFECKLFYNEENTKANLYASIGPKDLPGIILSGHTDVVPVSGQKWDTDPFTLFETEDKLYGRGTCDMKGFVAVCMSYAEKFSQEKLKIPIHFAFSYDEEVGCLGCRSMCDYISELQVKPFCCFVGEPSMMNVVRKHKGKQTIECDVKGFESHSSLIHEAVNAVEYAAEVVCKMRQMKVKRQTEGPFDKEFDPPYTSIHCGVFNGGEACNIVPKHCSFQGEWRFIPVENPDDIYKEVTDYAGELEKEMKQVIPESGFDFRIKAQGPALNTDESSISVKLAQEFSNTKESSMVSYMTEAGFFNQAGVPSVIIGPGSIENAHKPNEFVTIEQMKLCEAFMENIIQYATK